MEEHHGLLLIHITDMAGIFGQVLPPTSGVQDEVKTGCIVPSLQIILRDHPQEATAIINTYPPDVQSSLAQLLSQ